MKSLHFRNNDYKYFGIYKMKKKIVYGWRGGAAVSTVASQQEFLG